MLKEHQLFTEMKNAKLKTIWILEKFPATRDCDKLLYTYFVLHEIGNGCKDRGQIKLKNMTALEYLVEMSEHGFINYSSLARGRRKIQENPLYIHLEGVNKEGKDDADEFWRNNINKPD